MPSQNIQICCPTAFLLCTRPLRGRECGWFLTTTTIKTTMSCPPTTNHRGNALPKRLLLKESSFATLFPKYCELYLRNVWSRNLDLIYVASDLNLVEGSMKVCTTRRTSDSFVILKAHDLMKLLACSVPAAQALKILQDKYAYNVIKIGGTVRKKEHFVKQWQWLVGPEGATIKALKILTKCYVLLQVNTISVIGKLEFSSIKTVRSVVKDCMRNVHPVYNIQAQTLHALSSWANAEQDQQAVWLRRVLPQQETAKESQTGQEGGRELQEESCKPQGKGEKLPSAARHATKKPATKTKADNDLDLDRLKSNFNRTKETTACKIVMWPNTPLQPYQHHSDTSLLLRCSQRVNRWRWTVLVCNLSLCVRFL